MIKTLSIVFAITCALCLSACATQPTAQQDSPMTTPNASNLRVIALRLGPGEELHQALQALLEREQINSGFIMTCVGSLTEAQVRFADKPTPTKLEGKFEIVSLVGTVATSGSHLHIVLSDEEGRTIGGHLKPGNLVYTTAEIVIGVITDVEFSRQPDPKSGYNELVITPKP